MGKLRFFLIFLITQILFTTAAFSQGISIGQWREHLPYAQGKSITASDDKVFCATEYSVFAYKKADNSLVYYNTINGLSDVGVSVINYHKPTETLVIGYKNANIDLITKSGRVINLSDIYRKSITGNKTINEITFEGNLAYLACGFGIVSMDMEKQEIRDTYIIGPAATYLNINDIAVRDTAIYAATAEGLYFADDYQNVNLLDYRSWQKDTSLMKPNAPYREVAFFQDFMFLIDDYGNPEGDTVYLRENKTWDYFDTTEVKNFHNIYTSQDQMLLVSRGDIDFFDSSLNMTRRIYTYVDRSLNARDVLIDDQEEIWIADHSVGMVRSKKAWHFDIITPDGPRFINSTAMAYGAGNIWVATGGVDVSWNNQYRIFGVANFADGDWDAYYYGNEPAFDTIFDIMDVAVDPADGDHVFAGSWGKGIVEMKEGKVVKVYTDKNSPVQPRPEYYFMGIAGLTFDNNKNLWATNSYVGDGLLMKTPDGKWKSFDLRPASGSNELGDLVIDEYDQKWIIVPRSGGLVVFNDNNTYDIPGDDQVKRLSNTEGNGNLPSTGVRAIAKDHDGEIWVGTNKGIAVFYSPGNVFSNRNFDAQQIFIPRNDGTNTGTFLLETETVTEILVDGANRKWIGTAKAGLFLMSPEGREEIHHFTRDNSPLLSDNITSLTMNDQTGELFVGTDQGIISFRTEATGGGQEHNDVYAYPNPVPPEYNGKIAVKGLVRDANVKITDVSGNLIYQTIAKGGQAIWNGKNFDGERAHSGVYLVFSSNEDGEETMVTKILLVR
ncbi:MAG: hypothetical protein K9J21_05720 [Bacteroidales bacterium]|nr:hypothetical protein [Bacteroidales bacterium]